MNKLILIVEDSPTQALMLENILQKHDYQVLIANNGESALTCLESKHPALVIADIVMPGINGYELCRQIKMLAETKNIPVILLTSLSGSTEVLEGLAAGADSFISKPYDTKYLISHIQKIISGKNEYNAEKKMFVTEIDFEGETRKIMADQQHVIKLLLNIYEGSIQQNTKLLQMQENLRTLNENLETLVDERTEKLASQNALLNALMNSSEELLIFALDREYCYTTFNENHRSEMKKIWDADIKVGINYFDYLNSEEIRGLAKNSIDRALGGEFFTELQHQHGTQIYFEYNWNPIVQDDEVIGVTVFAKDISDRIRAEAELQQKNIQLEELNVEKDKLFSIIAHDLRSPLSAFMGFTELMVQYLPSMEINDLQEMAESMHGSAESLYRLLENLLQWAKIQQNMVSFDPEDLPLLPIITESIAMVHEGARKKNIKIEYSISEDINAFVDNNILQTVMRNLISNAVKFTPVGGFVKIAATNIEDGSLEIMVSDTGIGMREDMVKNLFDIHVKTNRPGTEGEPSSGLGLVLCKDFVEKLGGKIWVESQVGKGSVFTFSLPRKTEQEKPLEQVNDIKPEEINIDGLKILIAEDDEGSGVLLSMIVKILGDKVIKVRTGREAVQACRENPDLDLILTDVRMPQMDGYTAVRQIRQFNTKVVIIAQTAYAQTGEREIALDAGCNDYISKPIQKDKLLKLIHKYFRN